MQDNIIRIFQGTGTVDNVIWNVKSSEAVCSVSHPGLVIRVGGPVHIVVHGVVSVLQLFESEFTAEPLRKSNRHNPFVDVLIDCKRNSNMLKDFLRPRIKVKPFCGVHF